MRTVTVVVLALAARARKASRDAIVDTLADRRINYFLDRAPPIDPVRLDAVMQSKAAHGTVLNAAYVPSLRSRPCSMHAGMRPRSRRPLAGIHMEGMPTVSSPFAGYWPKTLEKVVRRLSGLEDKDALHVHFGAGRLGFGLVVPALVKGDVPFCIVSRPSERWAAVSQKTGEDVSVSINGEDALPGGIRIVACKTAEEQGGILGAVHRGLQENKRGFLVLCESPDALKPLLESATSFSCALGPGIDSLNPLLSTLPDRYSVERPFLYACENDHKSVERTHQLLRSKVEAVPCVVDRICAKLDLSPGGDHISVRAENFNGSIVLLKPELDETSPEIDETSVPLAGDGVLMPEKQAHAKYLYRKKLVTVNGLHTVIAFLSLCEFSRKQGLDYDVPDEPIDIPLISKDTLTEENMAAISMWSVAQLLVLMWEHGVPTMMQVHGVPDEAALVQDLLENSRSTLERFLSIEDSTARVLGGGVDNRYRTRLVPIFDTVSLDLFNQTWGPAQHLLLREASVSYEALKETLAKLVEDARPFAAVDQRVRAEKALQKAREQELEVRQHTREAAKVHTASNISILFDFDGTLGDTETAAMEVAFWEIAPYLPDATRPGALSNQRMQEYIRENAGKAFEFMMENCERKRAEKRLDSIEAVRAAGKENAEVLTVVNRRRMALGLQPLESTRNSGKTLLRLAKEETVESLRLMATPCDGVVKTLNMLQGAGFRLAISTTSPKPRVPVCIDKAGLREWFAPESIHSGESDFDPPRFKPDPAVYLKAAAAQETQPSRCIAVEDSTSGVGSAANAGIGLIVGYVGASHIPADRKHRHALSLLAGAHSVDGHGADVVLSNLEDLAHVANFVLDRELSNGTGFARPFLVDHELAEKMSGRFWFVNTAQGGG